jgi:hypothetical protein
MYYDCQWDAPAWMTRPGWLTRSLIVKTLSALLAVLMLASSAVAWRMTRPEPFRVAQPQVVYGGVSVGKDRAFHIGIAEIEAPGKEVNVLEVTPLMTDTVEFLGAVTSYGPDAQPQGGPGAAGIKFPPPYMHTTHPIGEVIPASATSWPRRPGHEPMPVIVSAGFRLKPGASAGAVNGIRVVYKVGDKKHTEIHRYAAVACTKGCPQMDADDDFPDHYLRQTGMLPPDEG